MKHSVPQRRDPWRLKSEALEAGWQPIETIPLRGEGAFLVLTISGLTRLARNRKNDRKPRRADSYGPSRITVNSVETGNYLGAIAWKWPLDAD